MMQQEAARFPHHYTLSHTFSLRVDSVSQTLVGSESQCKKKEEKKKW